MDVAGNGEPAGPRVLVAINDWWWANEIAADLARLGAVVVGPVPDVERARELASTERLDGAFVDVDLRGRQWASTLEELALRSVPTLLLTQRGSDSIPQDHATMPRRDRTTSAAALLSACLGRR